MKDEIEKIFWGQVEKIGKGTKASYDQEKKTITFAFNRDPHTTAEQLRKSRETLMKDLKELGHNSRMKYNGEVIVENVEEEEVVLEKKNHKLMIRLNKKQPPKPQEEASN